MKKMAMILTIVALAASANAAVTLQVTQSGDTYTFTAVPGAGETINAIEGYFSSGGGIFQEFFGGVIATPDPTYAGLVNPADSHFLQLPVAAAIAPNEDLAGTFLNGAFSITDTTSSVAIAQVTVAGGIAVDFTVRAAGGGAILMDESGTIPEPATMSLLALGGLALIRRRR